MTREKIIEKAEKYQSEWLINFPKDNRFVHELMADFHLEMMKLEDKTVCPKCGSDDNIVTLYCKKCKEAY